MASSSSRGGRIKMRAHRPREGDQDKKMDFSRWFSKLNQMEHFTEHFQNRNLITPRYCFLTEFKAYGF